MNNKQNKKQFKIEKKKFQIEKNKLASIANDWDAHTNEKIQPVKSFKRNKVEVSSESMPVLEWVSSRPSEISQKWKHFIWGYYIITNLALYNLDGEPVKAYSEVQLANDPIGESAPVNKTQDEWIEAYKEEKKKDLISLPLWYAIIEAAYDNKEQNSDAGDLLKSLREDSRYYMTTSTRLDHSEKKILHDCEAKDQIKLELNIPKMGLLRRRELSELVKEEEWEETLKAMFMTKDIEKIPKVIMGAYGKKTELLLLSDPERYGQKAVSVGFGQGNFVIYCNREYFGSDRGNSRWVIKSEVQ